MKRNKGGRILLRQHLQHMRCSADVMWVAPHVRSACSRALHIDKHKHDATGLHHDVEQLLCPAACTVLANAVCTADQTDCAASSASSDGGQVFPDAAEVSCLGIK